MKTTAASKTGNQESNEVANAVYLMVGGRRVDLKQTGETKNFVKYGAGQFADRKLGTENDDIICTVYVEKDANSTIFVEAA